MPKRTIMIVDDELSMRLHLRAMLLDEAYHLLFANGAQELFAKIDEHALDLIILDVVMPDVDGLEVCRRLKNSRQWQHIPVILTTVLNAQEVLEKGIEAGADDYLQKPVNKLELRARVRSMLRIKQQYDALNNMLHLREELSNMIVNNMAAPILSVLLHSNLLASKINDKEQRTHIEHVKLAAERLDDLVNDMLTAAKMEAYHLKISPEIINLNQLCRQVKKNFQVYAQFKTVQINVSMPGEPLEMRIDRNLFYRVLANLLTHCLNAAPAHSEVNLSVTAIKMGTQRHCRVQISDQSQGIDKNIHPYIFDKYAVVKLQKQGIHQVGLGLSFCKMALDVQGGKISIKNNTPHGTVFVVEI
jgi:signal transduction histidine kinase